MSQAEIYLAILWLIGAWQTSASIAYQDQEDGHTPTLTDELADFVAVVGWPAISLYSLVMHEIHKIRN